MRRLKASSPPALDVAAASKLPRRAFSRRTAWISAPFGATPCDNGPEFTSKALDAWAYQRGVKLHFIRPGKPVENAYVESFNGKLRNEYLNENWFLNLHDARRIIEAWRVDYNEVRPHSSLDGMTPKEYAEANRGLTLQVALRRGAGESPSRMP